MVRPHSGMKLNDSSWIVICEAASGTAPAVPTKIENMTKPPMSTKFSPAAGLPTRTSRARAWRSGRRARWMR
jgi:hypothetical protein